LALQESVEKRNCEGGVAVGGTEDHALLDEAVASWCCALDFDAEHVGNIARAMGARAELRHGTQIPLLGRGQAIEANSEEAFIEVPEDRALRRFHVPPGDW